MEPSTEGAHSRSLSGGDALGTELDAYESDSGGREGALAEAETEGGREGRDSGDEEGSDTYKALYEQTTSGAGSIAGEEEEVEVAIGRRSGRRREEAGAGRAESRRGEAANFSTFRRKPT